LLEAASYLPNTFDYSPAPGVRPTRAEWLHSFRRTTPEFRSRCETDTLAFPDETERLAAAARFAEAFAFELDALEAPSTAEINCLMLCALRDRLLRDSGFADCFKTVKAEENQKALALLPSLLAELDAIAEPQARLHALIQGVFAGNIFDLGASNSAALFKAGGGVDFRATRAKLQARPWTLDEFDRLAQRWSGAAHAKAVMFVDNSGSDVVLGMLPLCRELLRRGTAVMLAANSVASINDVTAEELRPIVTAIAAFDTVFASALADGRLTVEASGSDLPVIDLSRLCPSFCAKCAGADLVILEGQGRGIETNLRAAFACDALCLGMAKHGEVCEALGGGPVYGCVCRFQPAPQ
jgi:type II pantothenate kinase